MKALSFTIQNMAKVKVFKKWVKYHGQGQEVIKFGTNRKVLSKGIHI
jgi:hypothetical protein